MKTRTITFTVPDGDYGDYCNKSPGPGIGTGESCPMIGTDVFLPRCHAYDDVLREKTVEKEGRRYFYLLKCDKCLEQIIATEKE
jgi:hypothetical protein